MDGATSMWYINEIHIFLVGERWLGYTSRENTGDEQRYIRGGSVWHNYMAIIHITQKQWGFNKDSSYFCSWHTTGVKQQVNASKQYAVKIKQRESGLALMSKWPDTTGIKIYHKHMYC